MGLEINRLTVAYNQEQVIDHLNLKVEKGEMVALLGPSGSGKTTLMKAISGLLPIQSGEIQLDGKSLLSQPSYARKVAIVFQDLRLFPHMTVLENIAFPLKIRGQSKVEYVPKVQNLLKEIQLPDMEHRNISSLSGGQQQRIAMARALASQPQLLLLDEPFSGLDESLREEMGDFILDLQRRNNLTTILITHDKREAMRYANRIALLKNGKIHQYGQPVSLFEQPIDHYVAQFFGTYNTIEGRLQGWSFVSKEFTIDIELTSRLGNHVQSNLQNIVKVDAVIRPKQLSVSLNELVDKAYISLVGNIINITEKIDFTELMVELVHGSKLIINVSPSQVNQLKLNIGQRIYVNCHKSSIWLVEHQ